MAGASIEATLELWASSLRDVKGRIRPLFSQERVAGSAGLFLDGLLGNERGLPLGQHEDLRRQLDTARDRSDVRVKDEDLVELVSDRVRSRPTWTVRGGA